MVRKVTLPSKEEREAQPDTGKRKYQKSSRTLVKDHLREKRSRIRKEEKELNKKLASVKSRNKTNKAQIKKI